MMKKKESKKGFFAGIVDKMDSKLEQKAKKKKCCCCDSSSDCCRDK